MMPEFTAEAALAGGRHRYGRATINQSHPRIVPQQRETLPDGAAELIGHPAICTCPCCFQHDCGFLGLSTCLTCCD
jgi:hypothetical protein